jgi:hypothetical protein
MRQVVAVLIFGSFLAAPAARAETVTVSKQDCSRLIHHQPAPNVAYQPGVDVHGKKVASADLEGSGNSIKLLPEVLQFNVNINPVDYQARNALAKQKAANQNQLAANQQAIVDNQTAKTSAQAQVTSLTGQKATLVTQAATLAADLVALQAALAPLQAEVTAGTRQASNKTYRDAVTAVSSKQAEITANTAAQTTVTNQITAQQAIVDAAPGKESTLNYEQTSIKAQQSTIEAKQSALSAKGLDGTTMTAAQIKYDIAKNRFTINDQPLTSPDLEALAEACQKAGVK